jgi:endonuclease-3
MKRDAIAPFFATLHASNPLPVTELEYTSVFELLSAVLLSAQATREALQALPGVGRKTANVVLNSAYGEAVMAVDTHIFRVSNRTGLAPGKNVDEVEARLMKRVPPEYLVNAHHWLILHGRYVCQARQPLCGQCGVRQWCSFKGKTA